jgi:hypothetical protein
VANYYNAMERTLHQHCQMEFDRTHSNSTWVKTCHHRSRPRISGGTFKSSTFDITTRLCTSHNPQQIKHHLCQQQWNTTKNHLLIWPHLFCICTSGNTLIAGRRIQISMMIKFAKMETTCYTYPSKTKLGWLL